jgi:hypothetical protein
MWGRSVVPQITQRSCSVAQRFDAWASRSASSFRPHGCEHVARRGRPGPLLRTLNGVPQIGHGATGSAACGPGLLGAGFGAFCLGAGFGGAGSVFGAVPTFSPHGRQTIVSTSLVRSRATRYCEPTGMAAPHTTHVGRGDESGHHSSLWTGALIRPP